MRIRLTVMLVSAFVMAFCLLQAPAAFAQEQQRDPKEGEPKHEINELQNRLHQTDDPSKENYLEGKIDAMQEERQEARLTGTECLLAHIFTVGLFPLIEKGTTGRTCFDEDRAMPSGYLSELGFDKALFYLNFHGPRRQVEFSFPQQVAF